MLVVPDSEPVRRVVMAESVGRPANAEVLVDGRCGG